MQLTWLTYVCDLGSGFFNDFDTEFISERPSTVEEQLAACEKKLKLTFDKLRVANLKNRGKSFNIIIVIEH